MKIIILENKKEIGKKTAEIFKELIDKKPNAVLGLATGSSPITTYENLIEMNKNNEISFKDITTFNLDEYLNLDSHNSHSYRYFMNENLFNHIDININNTFIPDNRDIDNPSKYDEQIAKKNGIDLQLLGLGINGHIGFNEPGTSFDSLTSIVDLTKSTIEANARFFENKDDVPTQAISMGLKSIMNAKKIVLVAFGENKAEAIENLVNGQISANWPCTVLQKHSDVTIIIDKEAASRLKDTNDSK